MTMIPDLRAKWRLLRGNARYVRHGHGRPAEVLIDSARIARGEGEPIETQVQFAEALSWDKSELNRSLKEHPDEKQVSWLPKSCVPALLRCFRLDPMSLANEGVDLMSLAAEPLPAFCHRVRDYGGTDYQVTSWDQFVTRHGEVVSDSLDQGRDRLFLYAWPVSPVDGLGESRLLLLGESDLATGEVPDLPLAHVGDKAAIELFPARAVTEDRDLKSHPLHVLLFQDVKINGMRKLLNIDLPLPVYMRDPLRLPEGVSRSPSDGFNVPDERWGMLRKLVCLITDKPVRADVLGDPVERVIDPSKLDLLADRLLSSTYGFFTLWEFAYVVSRRP